MLCVNNEVIRYYVGSYCSSKRRVLLAAETQILP